MLYLVLFLLFFTVPFWCATLLLVLNILSQGLLKASVLQVRNLCYLDACGDHCLLIAVCNSCGSSTKTDICDCYELYEDHGNEVF